MRIKEIISRFNGSEKMAFSHLLIQEDIDGILHLVDENINNNSLLEYIIDELIDKDPNLLISIEKNLKLSERNKDILIKSSIKNKINLLEINNKFFDVTPHNYNEILDRYLSRVDEIKLINDTKIKNYVLDQLFINKKSELNEIYERLDEDEKTLLNNFFIDNSLKDFKKIKINPIIKSIITKKDIDYKGENELIKEINSLSNNFKVTDHDNVYDNDISYQFLNLDYDYLKGTLFISTNYKNKVIYINIINSENSLNSKIFSNASVSNKTKNNFLTKIEKYLSNKIGKIEDGYTIISNSFITKEYKKDIYENKGSRTDDFILQMANIILEENEMRDFDKAIGSFFDFMKEKKEKERNQ